MRDDIETVMKELEAQNTTQHTSLTPDMSWILIHQEPTCEQQLTSAMTRYA